MLTIANTPAEHAQGVLNSIEAEEAAFNMHAWIINTPDGGLKPDQLPSVCGTTLCAAGWFAHNAGWTIRPGGMATKDGVESHVEEVALDLLEASDRELGWLFYCNDLTAKNALRELAAGNMPDPVDCYDAEYDDDEDSEDDEDDD